MVFELFLCECKTILSICKQTMEIDFMFMFCSVEMTAFQAEDVGTLE